ncbi:polymorphic toxin-type HINT domain-containing protein [Pendulispora albinea]|uniref:HINT domain-containing protein n=1 Tax=Pendulispora albinea TaxID=2741071 RepID=A0ABZ2MB98_9BACT
MKTHSICADSIARGQKRARVAGLVRDVRGVSSVEYALVLLAILLAAGGAYRLLGQHGGIAADKATATLLGRNPTSNPGNGGAGGSGGSSSTGGNFPGSGGGGGAGGGGSAGGGAGGGGGGAAGDGWVCDTTSCRPGSGQCFVAGTLVATPEGARPIEQLVAGDRVLSRDEETGEFSARAVVRTFVRPATGLVDVHMARGDEGGTDVRSTAGHPYWTLAAGWTRADSLAPGDILLDPRGAEIRVVAVTPRAGEELVYNLEVEGTHTYFAGLAGAWVHNVNPNLAHLPPPNLPADPATWTPQQAESLASYLHDRFYGSSNQSHQGTTVAVGVYRLPNGQTSVIVNVSGDSWGGAGRTSDQILQNDQSGRLPLGNQPPPAMRDYLAQNGWGYMRENFHAETGLATYGNMNNAQGVVAGVSRPFCNTGVCESLMDQTFGLANVGVRQNVPSSTQINAQADQIAAAAAGGGGGGGGNNNGAPGPSNPSSNGCN